MRNFSKVFPYHLSSAVRWWVLGAENSPNWDGFFFFTLFLLLAVVVRVAAAKGMSHSFVWSREERFCMFPLILNTKLWCRWFPFRSLSVYLVFISGRSGIHVCCLRGGRSRVVFSSFWLPIPNCCHRSTVEPVSWGYFQLSFLWGTCLSFQPHGYIFLHLFLLKSLTSATLEGSQALFHGITVWRMRRSACTIRVTGLSCLAQSWELRVLSLLWGHKLVFD